MNAITKTTSTNCVLAIALGKCKSVHDKNVAKPT
jgi:hypothetical protein